MPLSGYIACGIMPNIKNDFNLSWGLSLVVTKTQLTLTHPHIHQHTNPSMAVCIFYNGGSFITTVCGRTGRMTMAAVGGECTYWS